MLTGPTHHLFIGVAELPHGAVEHVQLRGAVQTQRLGGVEEPCVGLGEQGYQPGHGGQRSGRSPQH